MTPPEPPVAIQVWDLPVRVVHWALAVLFAFQVASAHLGGSWMAWHGFSGYCILVLVVFRVLWGFAGTRHARFASFLASPAAVVRFVPRLVSREPLPYAGHNPLAGWMVVALFVALLLQAGSGLFANDGAGFEGPLARLVSFEVSSTLSKFHRANVRVLGVLVGLHVLAVVYHLVVRREELVMPMFTGVKRMRSGVAQPAERAVSPWRAPGLLAIALLFVYVVVGGFG